MQPPPRLSTPEEIDLWTKNVLIPIRLRFFPHGKSPQLPQSFCRSKELGRTPMEH